VNNAEFDEGWKHADFALMSDADSLFADVDHNQSGAIDNSDMDRLFGQYDDNGNIG